MLSKQKKRNLQTILLFRMFYSKHFFRIQLLFIKEVNLQTATMFRFKLE